MPILTISTKEMREDFSRVKQAMARGQTLLLLYRSRPIAKIKPVGKTMKLRSFSKKQINSWIKDDQLDKNQEKKIDKIINRLS